jgi:hypothetical protein
MRLLSRHRAGRDAATRLASAVRDELGSVTSGKEDIDCVGHRPRQAEARPTPSCIGIRGSKQIGDGIYIGGLSLRAADEDTGRRSEDEWSRVQTDINQFEDENIQFPRRGGQTRHAVSKARSTGRSPTYR